ncbi:uncharacterized protein LOC111196002 [Astyanax mexicanus]|uniref:uncharacterized protein LOC111196002 n=1 Tax=Astyanax mexicanus TaxID=7994 RepID=UPI0020CB570F|nr:uncharacterized protein LOC111196002 [Astyanax mexicanus]
MVPLLGPLSDFLRREWFRLRYTFVYFEKSSTVRGVRAEIIKGLKNRLSIKESEDEEECDVRMYFCPIVSRAGTDISAVLSRVRDDKPAIVIVLQHTFDEQAVVPSCREYEREKLVLVTFLFSEDKGLLVCQKNNEDFLKATHFLNRWAPKRINKQEKGRFGKIILYMLKAISYGCILWGLYRCIMYYCQRYWSVFNIGWYAFPDYWFRPNFQSCLKQPLYIYFPV